MSLIQQKRHYLEYYLNGTRGVRSLRETSPSIVCRMSRISPYNPQVAQPVPCLLPHGQPWGGNMIVDCRVSRHYRILPELDTVAVGAFLRIVVASVAGFDGDGTNTTPPARIE